MVGIDGQFLIGIALPDATTDPKRQICRKLASLALLFDDCELRHVVCVWNTDKTNESMVSEFSRIVFWFVLLPEIHQVHTT